MIKRLMFCLILVLAIAGCTEAVEPTSAPTEIVAAVATNTVAPTAVPATATAIPPTATNTPVPEPPTPTAVIEPTTAPTDEPTTTPAPTPEPVALVSDADFVGRSRLTGELVEDEAVLERRPIMCKISNSPAEFVRPQSGINSADMVIEQPIEGIYTRFVGVFQSETPERIGPIRSGRLIDIELVSMYDGALCFSGAAISVSRLIYRSPIRFAALRSWYEGYYRIESDLPYEHTFYADPIGLWEALDRIEQNRAQTVTRQTEFASIVPDGGAPATHVVVDYDSWTVIDWKWDAEIEQYRRWADGEEAVDAITEEQVTVENVLLIYAITQLRTGLCVTDTECHESAMETILEGRGQAMLLRDGQIFRGEWVRDGLHDMFTVVDASGNQVPFDIGRTWVQIFPAHFENTLTIVEPE